MSCKPLIFMVPEAGIEPARPYERGILSPAPESSALIGAILVTPSNGGVIPFVLTMVTLLCTITVWLGSYQGGYLFPEWKIRNILAYVGARSFAIYLVHNPSFWLTREIWSRIEGVGFEFNSHYNIRFCVTAIILIAVFAELNYRLIETPLRKRGIEKSKRSLASKAGTREPVLA